MDLSADYLSLQIHKPLKAWFTQHQTSWLDFKRCCGAILMEDQEHCRADLFHCQTMCFRPGVQVTLHWDTGFSALWCFHFKWGCPSSQWGSMSAVQMNLVKEPFFRDSEMKGTSQVAKAWIILLVFWLWMHVHPLTFLLSHVFLSFPKPYFLDAILQWRVWKSPVPSGSNTYFFRRPRVIFNLVEWFFMYSPAHFDIQVY